MNPFKSYFIFLISLSTSTIITLVLSVFILMFIEDTNIATTVIILLWILISVISFKVWENHIGL